MDRAIFKEPGDQARFLRAVKERLDLTWKEIAQFCEHSERTIHDWLGERCTMPAEAVVILSEISGAIPPPYEVISEGELWRREAASKGGRKGGHKGGKRRAELCVDLLPEWGRKGRKRTAELYSDLQPEWSRKAAQKLWELRRKHPERYKPVGGVKEIRTPVDDDLIDWEAHVMRQQILADYKNRALKNARAADPDPRVCGQETYDG